MSSSRIKEIKGIDLFYRICDDPSITVLTAGIFSLFPLRILGICRIQLSIYPLCLILILRRPLVKISWLQVTAWIVVSVPLYNVFLIFFY